MCSHDSWTNQQTLTGWLANVCSAIFKQQSHSYWSTRETMTFGYTEKAMQTRAEITMTTFSSLFSGVRGEQLAGKPRRSRLWLSHPAKLNIRAWQQLYKRQPCDPSSERWCISRWRQRALVKTTKAASNWRTTV